MLNKTLIIAFLIFLSSNIYGQVCGGGTRTVKVYTLNGKKAENLKFEYFSITPKDSKSNNEKTNKFIWDTFFPEYQDKSYPNFYGPKIIENKIAEKFLESYNTEYFYKPVRKKWRGGSEFVEEPINLKGSFKDGITKTQVDETYYYNFLMKISSDNYPNLYIAGSHFGLCSRTESILLDKEPYKINLVVFKGKNR